MPHQADALRDEIEFFEKSLPEWMKQHRGKYALVKGHELVDVFDTAENAYVSGVERFGNVPFLVRLISHEKPEVHLPALTLGVLRAGL